MAGKKAIEIRSAEFAELVRSQGFYDRVRNDVGRRILYEGQLHEPIVVEHETSKEVLDQILAHIQDVWTALGSEEPHWSVVSTSDFKAEKIAETLGAFNETGRVEVRNAARALARSGLTLSDDAVGLEYGCGVGRVTKGLAELCSKVVGVDVSSNHLEIADAYMKSQGVKNVELVRVSSFQDINLLPDYDFLYSKIVLQHNPPPIIFEILKILLKKAKNNGIGILQIPTYAKNYSFVADNYIETMNDNIKMEMHVLPQKVIFEQLRKNDCEIVEVVRDHLVTTMDFVSSTFTFVKR